MILDKVQRLQASKLVLASGSPRRKEILNDLMKLGVEIIPSTFEENLDKSQFTPETYVQENARLKALEVWSRLASAGNIPDLVIGSDTVVTFDGHILEKPRDKQDAMRMLGILSGRDHTVFSGVALLYRNPAADVDTPAEHCFVEGTQVTFAELSTQVIEAYVETGDPMDKAGSYGIQSMGGALVRGIRGCFYNVMGFPLHRFCVELSSLITDGRLALAK